MGRPVLSLAGGVLLLTLPWACGEDKGSGGPPTAPCGDPAAPAPVCGSSCKAMCGCRGCIDGEKLEIGGINHTCLGGCFEPGSGSGGAGGSGGSGGSGGTAGSGSGGEAGCGTCGPAAICGQCQDCCCDACFDGEPKTIGGKLYLCLGGCFTASADSGGNG